MAIEACWNWGKVFDALEGLPAVAEEVVAHPLKTRLIGEAQIKTDKIRRPGAGRVAERALHRPGACATQGGAAPQF